MRILIHGINYSPELTGIGKYSGEMAEWLAAHGHDVRVVTAQPYYPHWQILDGYPNFWKIGVSEPMGVKSDGYQAPGSLIVFRCPLWVPKYPTGLKRLVHLASFALSSFPMMLRQIFWCPDVVWVVEPPLFCAPQAWLVARLSGGKAWLHIQDYEVDAAFDFGLLKGALLKRVVMAGERLLMRRFDCVSTISQKMVERAIAKGMPPGRVKLFRNWVETADIKIRNQGIGAYRTELGIAADAVVALYSGSMAGKQGLEILAKAAQLLRGSPNIAFVFCGNGVLRESLIAQCKDLPNVHFIDLQPAERLGELLAFADIHLLPQRADAADLVMPSKLSGMLASGRPVVVGAHENTELGCVVKDCGLVVPPEQAQSFAEAIQKLACDGELRARLGAAGRTYAEENLNREVQLQRFEAELIALSEVGCR